ncbi:MAG: DUF4340 domain-containing protein [Treponema sp.]|nr:DUF4340 domain-containing protein [Treponema sp.]
MKTRKLVLIAADIILLAIFIVQLVISSRDTTKYFSLKEKPDALEIITPQEKVILYKEDENWFVGEQKYPANLATVDSFIDAVSNIRALDKVGSYNSGNNAERYEFVDGKKIMVVAKLGGKVLRTVEIGKTAVSSSQCYATIDASKDIYLVSGGLKDTFDTSVSAARSTIVVDLKAEEISAVTVTDYNSNNSWEVSRTGSGEEISWNASRTNGAFDVEKLDAGKATKWLESFANLFARDWYADDEVLEGKLIVSAKITTANKTVNVELFELPKANKDDVTQYYGKCSETPYLFKIGDSSVKQYLKTLEELSK